MLIERDIREDWVWRTMESPDRTEAVAGGATHYLKAIDERDGRTLRVVVNTNVKPKRVVTVFFDRRQRRTR